MIFLLGFGLIVSAIAQNFGVDIQKSIGILDKATWTVLIVTVLGLVVAVTPLARITGSAEISNVLLYSIIALLASRASFAELKDAPIWIITGFVILGIHGKQSDIHIANGSEIFLGLAPIIKAARYHSLIVAKEDLPDELLVIAESAEGEIMGIKHRDFNVFGVQFHPESIMTPDGSKILANFLKIGAGK